MSAFVYIKSENFSNKTRKFNLKNKYLLVRFLYRVLYACIHAKTEDRFLYMCCTAKELRKIFFFTNLCIELENGLNFTNIRERKIKKNKKT